MQLSSTLASRLQEVYLDGKWIAQTNYSNLLHEIPVDVAVKKVGSLNSITQLTYHINYYLAGLIQVLDGGELDIRDKYSFDLSPISSEEDWQQLISKLLANANSFIHAVKKLSNDNLLAPFVKEEYGTYLRNIEGVIEHSYYHLGQIALIRKMLMENDS
jgi:hypothetical protein